MLIHEEVIGNRQIELKGVIRFERTTYGMAYTAKVFKYVKESKNGYVVTTGCPNEDSAKYIIFESPTGRRSKARDEQAIKEGTDIIHQLMFNRLTQAGL